MLEVKANNWYRDNYLISTEPNLLQVEAVNAALSSDLVWWANGLPLETTKKALHNSLCLGLYALPQSTSEIAGHSSPKQIGLLRVVTDDVTFAYLTDVYVQPEYQGKGLGRWMLECLDEIIKGWPHLRRFMFLTNDAMDLYRKTIGAKEWSEAKTEGVQVGTVEGPGWQQPQ
ncbi:acetyltransferase [Pseudomassariella vexata]|uniref:Acetyltransferase n=1 Tax=Pseudomassariella vexata TaxID=1141098 RepID=A0A1Y2DGP5_9PEZI|nr:acetyltransferase [Pseudomassariella vexata]ORY58397.1 acetyltransferase [Pseudomassariella vexata]